MKKIIGLILALVMVLSTVSPVMAEDVTLINDGYETNTAIQVLKSLGIIVGDENGNLNLDKSITRAEFSTILLRELGMSNVVNTKDNTIFTDVPKTHWASGVVNYCYNAKIIAGYGNNTFGPDDTLTYEQAVKMLVCALGYEEMAKSKGTYPTGYLMVASNIGLLDNCDNSNARFNIIQMCYNALDIPVMEQTGFGTDVKYEVMNKTNDHNKVTLLTKQNIYKLGGIVAANSKIAFKTSATVQEKGYIEFWWDNDFDSPVSAWEKKSKNEPNYADSSIYYGAEILEIGDTDVDNAIGNQINIYVKKNVSKYTVLAYEIDETSNSITMKADMLDDSELNFKDIPAYFKYFKTEDANKSTKINLENSYSVIWNNVAKDSAYLTNNLNSSKDAVIELIDFNDNNKYDVVKVICYNYKIVEEVSVSKGIIEDINGNRINLDIDNEDAKVSIVDELNNPISIEDIKPTDVLAMIVNTTQNNEDNALRNASYDSLDIIVLKDWYVEGTITGTSEEKIMVNKDSYDYTGTLDLGTEGIFYLNLMKTGIIGYDKNIVKSDNYAYIISTYYATNKDEADKILTFELITEKGLVEYKTANRIKIDDDKFDIEDKANEFKDKFAGEPTATAEDTALRIIKFELNSKDEIVEIVTAKNSNNVEDDLNYTTVSNKVYNADNNKIGTKYLSDNTKVLKIDYDNIENSKITDVKYFVDENIYSALLFDLDEKDNYALAAVYSTESIYADGAAVAIVKSVYSVQNEEEDEVTKVVAYQNEEEITLYFDEDSISGYGISSDSELSFGTIILYNADGKGYVDKYDIIGSFNTEENRFAFDEKFALAAKDEDKSPVIDFEDGDAYFFGYIAKCGDNKLQIVINEDLDTDYTSAKDSDVQIDDKIVTALDLSIKGANQYTLSNKTKTSRKIEVGDYRLGNITEASEGIIDDKYEVYYVFIRTYEGDIVDIVSFDVQTENIEIE